MEQIHDRVAGLDVHRDQVTVCVRTPGPRGGVQTEKARFDTTTGGLAALAGWLAGREVTLAAMEATGVYWKPIYYALEERFEVWLCNAHHVKNVPGRKTDMSDAEWLADVVAHGMVRPSFVPPPLIRQLRDLTRYRKRQIDTRAAEVQRLEKVLQDASRMPPFTAAVELLIEVPGLNQRSAEVVLAETGGDMSRFPSPAHLASWAGLCPGNYESAGKRKRVGTTNGSPWLRRTLIES